MILYQALSSYQILECMIHRQVFHKEEKCVLLLGTFITERMPQYREIRTRGFFQEIYLFPFGGYKGSEKEILEKVEQELKRVLPYDIREFQEILAAGIHTYLEMYLLAQGIPFSMFEDGSGALSRPEILGEIHRKSAPARYALIEKYGLYRHTSPLIQKKYCDFKAQIPGFFDEKAVDFQVLAEFYRLSPSLQKEIRKLFGLPFLEGGKSKVLLLTQQFANLGQLSLEGQKEIYTHLFHYYLKEEQVLIKPHPDDILYYPQMFPKASVIPGSFPSELLPLVFRELPQTLCTVSSTGVNQIQGEFPKHLFFHALYEESYIMDACYYMALRLAAALGAGGIWGQGTNPIQLENLMTVGDAPVSKLQMMTNAQDFQTQVLCIQDDFTPTAAKEKEGQAGAETDFLAQTTRKNKENVLGVLYLNSRYCYSMYSWKEKEKFLSMVPIVVCMEQGRKHTMYFQTEKEEVKRMAKDFAETYVFPDREESISIEKLTDEQMEIEMLKGILKATEKRLLEYIEAEKELRRELSLYKDREGTL